MISCAIDSTIKTEALMVFHIMQKSNSVQSVYCSSLPDETAVFC